MTAAMLDEKTVDAVKDFVLDEQDAVDEIQPQPDPFWQGLCKLGSELWLDTGDIDAANQHWTSEFSALTTNNSLLNKEVQKGLYDDLMQDAGGLLAEVEDPLRVIEIAFILNARHGLRLVRGFGANVSVELHTDVAHDLERSIHYGLRYHELCPEHFIVKVPLTATGLLATRRLREEGVKVNFTLGFSARQNALATVFAKPSYVNVFLGRVNAYASDNNLSDGKRLGEKTTLASQRCLWELTRLNREPTRQIAASLREAQNIKDLAGVDVFTMPTSCAAEAKESFNGNWRSQVCCDWEVQWDVDPDEIRAGTLYDVPSKVVDFAKNLDKDPPVCADEIIDRADGAGLVDMLPCLSEAELQQIADDGKIPKHERWKDQIADGSLAIDTLLNLAGLAAFTADQAELDQRIRDQLS